MTGLGVVGVLVLIWSIGGHQAVIPRLRHGGLAVVHGIQVLVLRLGAVTVSGGLSVENIWRPDQARHDGFGGMAGSR